MKNFPHQYNRFSLLRRTLATIADLNRAGSNVADDGVLGYQLARRGVYTFRDLQGNLEDRIRAEQRKPEGSQGARTAAREIRRTLRYLDFLDNGLQVTPAGEQLLKSAEGSPEERAIWQVALMNMPLDDQGDVSHPVRILLRLVEHSGQLAREEMALALEARDDSDAEFQRILGLVPVRQAIQAGTLNTTKYQADNAVKILPSFAEQAGLIVRPDPFSPYTLTAAGQTALGAGLATGPVAVRPQPAPPRQARPAQGGVQTLPADPRMPAAATSIAALSPEEQAAAARLRFERTARHQMLLGKVADYLRPAFALYEGTSSFDLVALRERVADEALLLVEIKSLETDAQTQARLAAGQILYYEHIVVSGRWPGRTILRAAVFEGPIPDYLCDFLEWLQIGAFEYSGAALRPLNNTARTIATWMEDRLRRRGSGAGP